MDPERWGVNERSFEEFDLEALARQALDGRDLEEPAAAEKQKRCGGLHEPARQDATRDGNGWRPSAKTADRGELATGVVGFGLRPAAIPRPAEAAEASRWAAGEAQLPPAAQAAGRAAAEEFLPAAVPPA